ncbi:MAG: hypothetical protein ACRDHZ_25495, partial [Ktedonobacteraceae bacterium]
MKQALKRCHWWIRLAAAALFWLNATGVFRPSLSPTIYFVATELGIESASVSIILALLACSLLSLYGVRNAVVSVVYIYTFPFVLTWYVSRHFVRSIRWMQRVVRKAYPSSNEGVPISELMPLWRSVAVVKTKPIQEQAAASAATTQTKVDEERGREETVLDRVLRVSGVALGRSTLLCGLLMVVSSARWVIIVSLAATTIGLIRTNILFLQNVLGVKQGTVFVKENFIKWIDSATERTQADINNGRNKDNPLGGIRVWKFLLNVVAKAREVPELVAVGGLLVFVASYAWIASVFYFIYVGVTKLTAPGANGPKAVPQNNINYMKCFVRFWSYEY